jgi:hypothetical protein
VTRVIKTISALAIAIGVVALVAGMFTLFQMPRIAATTIPVARAHVAKHVSSTQAAKSIPAQAPQSKTNNRGETYGRLLARSHPSFQI